MSESRMFVAKIDQSVFFIKKGFSFWKHLVPFSVAALLLIVLSLSPDNLLLKLVHVLDQPGILWIPASLLTVVAVGVYYASIFIQVRQAHLWTEGNRSCSLITAIIYLSICTLMAYGVLLAANYGPVTLGSIWACFLLATLSLTGVGWSVPDTWVKTIGITVPDYTDARAYARTLKFIVDKTASKDDYAEERDITDFLKTAESLRDELMKNKNLEPRFTSSDPDQVIVDIGDLIRITKDKFPLDNDQKVKDFKTACTNDVMSQNYPGFVPALKKVKSYWLTWKESDRSAYT